MAKKIAFNWAWGRAKEIFPTWRDGLRTAIEIIAQTHDVDWVLGEEPEDKYDFILVWGADNAPVLQRKYSCPVGLCYGSTFPPNVDNLRNISVIYVENMITYGLARQAGLRTIKAFGTDTDFFSPKRCKKDIEYFFPATFSPWKKQSSIAYLGDRLLCVGEVQPDGGEEYRACFNKGVQLIPENVSSEKVRDFYRRSEKVIIPARYGSERTVLEAMSNNILPEIMVENDRAIIYVQEFIDSHMKSPRAFVKKYYSAKVYADQLMKGME